MISRRHARKLTAGLAAAALLFAQLAVAAHACAAGVDSAAAAMAEHGAMPCAEMDAQPKDPCLQHCLDKPQSFDNHPPTTVVPAADAAYLVDRADRAALVLESTYRRSDALLARVTAPPLAVRNCCLRI
jgi:hypothetical protein